MLTLNSYCFKRASKENYVSPDLKVCILTLLMVSPLSHYVYYYLNNFYLSSEILKSYYHAIIRNFLDNYGNFSAGWKETDGTCYFDPIPIWFWIVQEIPIYGWTLNSIDVGL